jgi:tetratricopeptide (TPR) repeat protein
MTARAETSLRGLAEWPYLAAAAVLPSFTAVGLRPIGGREPDLSIVVGMLGNYADLITSGSAKGRWRLRDVSRRAALQELSAHGGINAAIAANPTADNAVGAALAEIAALTPGTALDLYGRSFEQLLALDRALSWLGDAAAKSVDPEQLRAALARLRLLDPLQRLLTNGFAGRVEEMKRLRAHVDELPSETLTEALVRGIGQILDVFRVRPPLVLKGPGGVGKSTLVAKFLDEHAGAAQHKPMPFVFLDFDRSILDPTKPDTVVLEIIRQLVVQIPEFSDDLRALLGQAERWFAAAFRMDTHAIEEAPGSDEASQVSHRSVSRTMREHLGRLLSKITAARDQNLLLFIDTFEIVQRRGPGAVHNILQIAAQIVQHAPRVRVVVAGRGGLDETDFERFSDPRKLPAIPLEGFDLPSARAYLRARITEMGNADISDPTLDRIVQSVHGNPLSLRLAAAVFRRYGMDGIDHAIAQTKVLAEAKFAARFTAELLQGVLHQRIVEHLPEPLRKIADPGLVVRKLTPAVIREVLAEPCALSAAERDDAEQIIAALAREVSLMKPAPDGSLIHRRDVRLLMLPLLRERRRELAREIDLAATRYWFEQPGALARAEAIYHRLWSAEDEDRREVEQQLEEFWLREPPDMAATAEALDELNAVRAPAWKRLWLYGKLGWSAPLELLQDADRWDLDRHADIQATDLMADGRYQEALSALSLAKPFSPQSRLWLHEIDVLRRLDRLAEALEVTEVAIAQAAEVADPKQTHDLFNRHARLLAMLAQPDRALISAEQATGLAQALGKPTLQLDDGLIELYALRALGRRSNYFSKRLELAGLVNDPTVEKALLAFPLRYLNAIAELGSLRPNLLVVLGTALRREGGRESVSVGEANIETAIAAASISLGDPQSVVGSIENLVRSGDVSTPGEPKRLDRLQRSLMGTWHRLARFASRKVGRAASRDPFWLGPGLQYLNAKAERDGIRLDPHVVLGDAYRSLGEPERSEASYTETLVGALSAGSRSLVAAEIGLGNLALAQGDFEKARERYLTADSYAAAIADDNASRLIALNLGALELHRVDLPAAETHCRDSVHRLRVEGESRILCRALLNLGVLEVLCGRHQAADEVFAEATRLATDLGDSTLTAGIRSNQAGAVLAGGDRERARRLLTLAMDMQPGLPVPVREYRMRVNFGVLEHLSGNRPLVRKHPQHRVGLQPSGRRDCSHHGAVAAPGPITRRRHHPRANRIQHHVPRQLQ